MKDEMEKLLKIVKKLKEERIREYIAAVMAGDETKSKQLDYAVEAFGMVEWIIKDPKYEEYIRRIYEIDTVDEQERREDNGKD